ncbi:MAG: hypothetical protein CVU07_09410 [Bacteroidetes bacterium HGW-Bacteroidetes-23]|nr:MAG: hypothetical protein CVU07_09410 [Bacteroidetes bacterium HGW-Bacteroidetes-23]
MLITFVTSDILSSIDFTFKPFVVNFILIIGLISFVLGIFFINYIFKFNKIQKIGVVNNSIEKPKNNSQEIHQIKLSSNDALNQLKEAKQKLDLELISQDQYNVIKEELRPFIN